MTAGPDHREGVAAWQEHLRQGGTTPWREFVPGRAEVPRRLGSAVHLELIRRLDSGLPDFMDLADRILATPTPGRGSVDVPVSGDPAPGPGAPPVDPGLLGAEELLRLASAVLAPLVLEAKLPKQAPARTRLRVRRFRVWGAPLVRHQLRGALIARGWRESPVGGTTFVVGAPVEDGVAQVWARRIERGSLVTWPRLWRRFEARGRLPSSLDFTRMVETAHAVGGRVVSLSGSVDEVARRLQVEHGLTIAGAPDLVAIDLTRRLNAVLTTRVPAHQRPGLAPAVATVIGRSENPLTSLAVPAGRREWAHQHADPVAGYAHPQADALDRVPPGRALDLALAAIGRGWAAVRGQEG